MPEPACETRPLREDERDWLSQEFPERRGRELIVAGTEPTDTTSKGPDMAGITEQPSAMPRRQLAAGQ